MINLMIILTHKNFSVIKYLQQNDDCQFYLNLSDIEQLISKILYHN